MSKKHPKTGPLAADPAVHLTGQVQVIEQDGEPRFAVLPWKEWRAIAAALEDRSDALLVTRSEARIAAGEETIPGEVINAIVLHGETPLAAYRKWRGLKQVDLAAGAGLNQAYVSELEAGKKTPSLEALQSLAAILDLDVGLLIPPRPDADDERPIVSAKPNAARPTAAKSAKRLKVAKAAPKGGGRRKSG